jgi:DNA-binding NarL/FixJ family response regulator
VFERQLLSYRSWMLVKELVQARDRMIAAVNNDLSESQLLPELVAALHSVATFDRCALIRMDPDTLLPSAGAVEGFEPSLCLPFWDNELLDPDFAKFIDLARSDDPVSTLYAATDGDLQRSPRYRKLYQASDAVDELRVAFRSGRTCWAVAVLVRPAGNDPFPIEEIQAVRELVPVAARALRHAAGHLDDAHRLAGPAMIVVAEDGNIETMTADADALLHDLRTHGLADDAPPTAVIAAARRAKSSRISTRIACRARGASGRWLKLHASPLGSDGRVAVMIEPARATDIVPILLESYGLTDRETEVVTLVARGLATKEIAAELCISTHTVNDHIKVIFAKCGVSSRGELVARLFADHLYDACHETITHLP